MFRQSTRTKTSYSSMREEKKTVVTSSLTISRAQTIFDQVASSPRTVPSISRSASNPVSFTVSSFTNPSIRNVNNSMRSDARPFGSPNHRSVPSSSKCLNSQARYDLTKNGFVLIFHNIFEGDSKMFRQGSDKDIKLIKKFFKNYRVKVVDPCEDYTIKKMKKKMAEMRKKNFQNYSCIIVIIMSHGENRDTIRAIDGMYNLETEIVEPLLMNSSLKDKPKLFFVQACKGNALMETDFLPTATNKLDILKCFSTYEGTVSLRHITNGTFFIQSLFKLIEEDDDKDIIEIMKALRNHFNASRIQQAPTETSTLTKSFYFSDLKKK